MTKSLILIFFAIHISNTQAFDCSVIYDEFDSLMHKEFLVSPDNYVPTVSGEISFNDFNATQRGKFHLRKDRPEKGIGIIFSNDKLYGKFLFDWQDQHQIIFEDIIFYHRIEDGYAPQHNGPITVNAGEYIDLNDGEIYTNSDDEEFLRADLEISNNQLGSTIMRSINEARVYFPTTSLCK